MMSVAHADVSASLSNLIAAAKERGLARHQVWLKLLHYNRRGERSEIHTQDFFLSPRGASDPEAELVATLAAYFSPPEADPDQHARCRFPARYFWLMQQLPLPNYALRDGRCQRLERWALFDRVRSVSLLQVSGYLGNPASTFGHALLKFNTDAPDDKAGLFDLSLNFGALVPENEATIVYIARGLFGGYEAGFSDKYFYTQDLVYVRTEFRDIWDYRLRLSDSARTLLALHIWEIVGKKFDYYFLTENCAYRLAELLELVTGETFLDDANAWYVPVELFHRLVDVDRRRVQMQVPGLIQSVHFIPSSQRTLYEQFARLGPAELTAANEIVAEQAASLPARLAPFQRDRQAEILDAALAYYEYRLVAGQPTPGNESRASKDRVLRARLQVPPRKEPTPAMRELPPPADGSRPMLTSLGLARGREGDGYGRLSWSPFSRELIGNNSIDGDELAVLDFALGFGGGQGVFLDGADFIRIRKLNASRVFIVGESRVSWELDVAARRVNRPEGTRIDEFISYGIGRAWQWSETMTGYVMVDFAEHALSPRARAQPHVGIVDRVGPWRAWVRLGVENTNDGASWTSVWSGKVQYELSTNRAVRAEFSNQLSTRASIAFVWYR